MILRLLPSLMISAVTVIAFSSVGCNPAAKTGAKKTDGKTEIAKTEPKHDGWWCQEHGVPEGDCSLCLPDDVVKKRFKDTGDWCKEHERAQSQCFKCDPSKYKKFEEMYAAHYGKDKKPEPPPASEFKK